MMHDGERVIDERPVPDCDPLRDAAERQVQESLSWLRAYERAATWDSHLADAEDSTRDFVQGALAQLIDPIQRNRS